MALPIKHISTAIEVSPTLVYGYAANPENLPNWAAGLASGVRKVGDFWETDSPMGTVKVKFAEKNTYGILDHVVTLPDGQEILNPMRVLPNDKGSEVVFTLFQLKGMSDEEFERDAGMVRKDLASLKKCLEEKKA